MRDGRLAEAQARFAEQVQDISANRTAEPDNAQWKSEWPNARLFLTEAQATTGAVADARRGAREAAALARELVKQDPTNQAWQLQLGKAYWWQARLDSLVTPARAVTEAREAERVLAAAHTAEPKSSFALHWLTKSTVVRGELAWRRGALDVATTLLAQADAKLTPALTNQQNTDAHQLLPAELKLLQGNVAARRGDLAAAQAAWSAAERVLRDGDDPPAFDRLDLLVRVLLAQHRDADAAPYLTKLNQSGYVPLYPWQEMPTVPPAVASK